MRPAKFNRAQVQEAAPEVAEPIAAEDPEAEAEVAEEAEEELFADDDAAPEVRVLSATSVPASPRLARSGCRCC